MNGKSSYELPDLSCSMGAHLGIQFLEMEEGYVKAQMPVDERTCQPFGILNGGASLALAEIVAGHGSIPLCPQPAIARQDRARNQLIAPHR